jgi:hypothetical protein
MKASSTFAFIMGSVATIGIGILLKKKNVDIVEESGKAVSNLATAIKEKLSKAKPESTD